MSLYSFSPKSNKKTAPHPIMVCRAAQLIMRIQLLSNLHGLHSAVGSLHGHNVCALAEC